MARGVFKTTVRAFAAEFGWDEKAVYNWIRAGWLPARWSWRKFDYLVDEDVADTLRKFDADLQKHGLATRGD